MVDGAPVSVSHWTDHVPGPDRKRFTASSWSEVGFTASAATGPSAKPASKEIQARVRIEPHALER